MIKTKTNKQQRKLNSKHSFLHVGYRYVNK